MNHSPDAAQPTAQDPTEILRQLMEVSSLNETRHDEEMFLGPVVPNAGKRVFGGQVLGQALVAANQTVPNGRFVHSLHAYFLRGGDAHEPIEFGVEKLRDGRSFSARRVHAYQHGRTILSMMTSFQDWDEGLDHADPMPSGIPDPESLPTAAQLLTGIDHPAARYIAELRPFDIRHVEAPLYLPGAPSPATADNAVWMKTFTSFEGDEPLQRAALAYASDFTLLEPILRRHGLTWANEGMSIASLDHAMWFHRPVRADEWLLYVQHSPSASGARGLGIGRIYNRAGQLVATASQEGMVRVPQDVMEGAR
ncbi:acyl-CoA thioesterase II [Falsarthrobacter nasiphocae]|uniref:Acyl-CoA thioesterase 2 n=1 Tax=Falsarthrobacter nasiphocae TaxID=189863 RepID=A0AAE3YJ30_9MICC|nr:acyl-CoA thioesterase II [Falsarthrobacter nasiphocae]MDR6892903.1 acyl-CoA thioesterase-2 [Falsarthrobacter nasiphocae]